METIPMPTSIPTPILDPIPTPASAPVKLEGPALAATKIYDRPLLPPQDPVHFNDAFDGQGEPDRPPASPPRSHPWIAQLLVCTLLCCGALACRFFYPAGCQTLRSWIVGTGQEPLQVAVSSFDQALRSGRPVAEAFAVFYDEITAPAP